MGDAFYKLQDKYILFKKKLKKIVIKSWQVAAKFY